MRTIYYWPDGTWCDAETLAEYHWKSDDYGTIDVPDDLTDGSVDIIVDRLM